MQTYKGDIIKLQANQSVIYGATSEERIELLYTLADKTPEQQYIIPYTADSTYLPSQLTPDKLAYMFACRSFTPLNIIFEESFCELVDKHKAERQYVEGKAV